MGHMYMHVHACTFSVFFADDADVNRGAEHKAYQPWRWCVSRTHRDAFIHVDDWGCSDGDTSGALADGLLNV